MRYSSSMEVSYADSGCDGLGQRSDELAAGTTGWSTLALPCPHAARDEVPQQGRGVDGRFGSAESGWRHDGGRPLVACEVGLRRPRGERKAIDAGRRLPLIPRPRWPPLPRDRIARGFARTTYGQALSFTVVQGRGRTTVRNRAGLFGTVNRREVRIPLSPLTFGYLQRRLR
jgi:hypothetical protein